MDPLSITTGVMTLLAATSASVKGLQKIICLRDAPDEFRFLLNEVTSLGMVLRVARLGLQSVEELRGPSVLAEASGDVASLMQSLEQCIQDLENFVNDCLKKTDENTNILDHPKLSKRAWLKRSQNVEKLRARIRDAKSNFQSALSTLQLLLGYVCACTSFSTTTPGHSYTIDLGWTISSLLEEPKFATAQVRHHPSAVIVKGTPPSISKPCAIGMTLLNISRVESTIEFSLLRCDLAPP